MGKYKIRIYSNAKIDLKDIISYLNTLYIIALFVINGEVPYIAALVLILIIGVNVFKERFYDTVYTTIASFILIV